MRSKLVLSLALIISATTLGACTKKPPKDMDIPTCTTFAQCVVHDGKRVEIVGTYAEFHPRRHNRKVEPPPSIACIQLGDKRIFLAPFWSEKIHRPQKEKDEFMGKKVRVRGTFHTTQPDQPDAPQAVKRRGAVVAPNDGVELAGD